MNSILHRLYVGSFFMVGFASLALLIYHGFDYYSLPIEARFFSDSHQALKPSGNYGHGFGILGTLMMIFGVAIYMMRKRKIFTFGYLKHWLEFHIFLCTVGPMFVLFHTAFKFGGIVQISFWSMVAVVVSGVLGRFIYIQIPRTIQGREMDINELTQMNEELNASLANQLGKDTFESLLPILKEIERDNSTSQKSVVASLLFGFLDRKKELRQLKNKFAALGITDSKPLKTALKIADQKMLLHRRIAFLKVMQNWFRYWHIIHLPFAISMFVIMIIHVIVTIVFGYGWIF